VDVAKLVENKIAYFVQFEEDSRLLSFNLLNLSLRLELMLVCSERWCTI